MKRKRGARREKEKVRTREGEEEDDDDDEVEEMIHIVNKKTVLTAEMRGDTGASFLTFYSSKYIKHKKIK